jgi:probable phosphoglycerate mutase
MAQLFDPFFKNIPLTEVLTSPRERARTTCELAGLSKQALIEPNLREWDYGDYEGLTSKEIQEKIPGWNIFKNGCPGGETLSQVGTRADQVIARIRAVKGDVALFAHGHIFKILTARWVGLEPAGGSHFELDTGSLSILSYYGGYPVVKQWNIRQF